MDFQTFAMIDNIETQVDYVSTAHHTQELKMLTDTAGMMFAVLVKFRLMLANAKHALVVKSQIKLEEHALELKPFTIK